jgi:hypothetical protein
MAPMNQPLGTLRRHTTHFLDDRAMEGERGAARSPNVNVNE